MFTGSYQMLNTDSGYADGAAEIQWQGEITTVDSGPKNVSAIDYKFNASKDNAKYGSSSTIQPESIRAVLLIRF